MNWFSIYVLNDEWEIGQANGYRSMGKLTGSLEWKNLVRHAEVLKRKHLKTLFNADTARFERFSLTHGDLLIDFSKQRIDTTTLALLRKYAEFSQWQTWRDRMFAGEAINHTEGRAVGHWRLRAGRTAPDDVRDVLGRMERFCNQVRFADWVGFSGKPIRHIVNIGIGGSDLGPRMLVEALKAYHLKGVRVHFVSNLDGADLATTLEELDAESTLFIVASKTFTTKETMTNANTARNWLLQKFSGEEKSISRHFVAASCNVQQAERFGISTENVFPFSDWVGGRFSVCSSVGLSVALAIGFERFQQFLGGARDIDQHFFSAPIESNVPLTLALLSFWNGSFLGARSEAVFPYSHSLRLLPAYLQQLEMESNGKRIDRDGTEVDYLTSPIIWGESGSNGQHSFFQLLHQGTELVSSDFIVMAEPDFSPPGHHDGVLANCLAQSSALAFGKSSTELEPEEIQDSWGDYRCCPGNQPSNTLVLPTIEPFTLGQLVAIYEHKTFCLGVLWNLNSFDQWGVEFGKLLADRLRPVISGNVSPEMYDASTRGIVAHFSKLKHKFIKK
ncbi:glucose-6-phosphate isomerase [Azonexus caeni]|uniref:glucose-6-phosphate isomerase n=1 Tax=Azonexus caeni TaxID=266126 RepID=UPI003A899511